MTAADTHAVRDPELPGKLLAAERDALIPLLRGRPEHDFEVRTCCPGWTVRHVLAHCSAALSRVVESRYEEDVFSPEANDRDIAERSGRSLAEIVDELERGMTDAGPVIAKAGGALDGVGLGEWVHAGDVRDAWGEPGAYAGPQVGPVLDLLAWITRDRGRPALGRPAARPLHRRRRHPRTAARGAPADRDAVRAGGGEGGGARSVRLSLGVVPAVVPVAAPGSGPVDRSRSAGARRRARRLTIGLDL
ncbi:maleylpyruvate isomerase family mycothiol-dependent enzyme [Streptomyces phaeochromogenes]|uniref:maleylpyruvate isomerase family mycothiol-dependent enzyme n=1 Tax=Streptomyces phaeochromogenes TaxID=1923 RepID=UPI0033C5311A